MPLRYIFLSKVSITYFIFVVQMTAIMFKRIVISFISCILAAVVICSAHGISHVTYCCMSCEDSGWEVLSDNGCHSEPEDEGCCDLPSGDHSDDAGDFPCHADSHENPCSFSLIRADIDFMNHRPEMPSCDILVAGILFFQLPISPDKETVCVAGCSYAPPISGRQRLSLHAILLI